MSLKTYVRDRVVDEWTDWPLHHLDDEGRPVKNASDLPFRPGDTVCHVREGGTGYGTVVAVSDDQVMVLWSEEPAAEPDFSNITFPVVRQVAPTLVAQELVSIQPMSVPSGLVFYMDYAYGSGSLAVPSEPPADTNSQTGPTVGPTNNPCPSNGVAIGSHRQYLGPGYRGPKRGGR